MLPIPSFFQAKHAAAGPGNFTHGLADSRRFGASTIAQNASYDVFGVAVGTGRAGNHSANAAAII